jgi:hypothetical protein
MWRTWKQASATPYAGLLGYLSTIYATCVADHLGDGFRFIRDVMCVVLELCRRDNNK